MRAALAEGSAASASTDGPVKRWLAARLFGAWTAYQGDGLAVTLRHLRRCLDTFEQQIASDGNVLEAIRRSDVRILHTAGPDGPDSTPPARRD